MSSIELQPVHGSRRRRDLAVPLSLFAIVVSTVAVIASATGRADEAKIESRVEARISGDLYTVLKPVYADFGVEGPAGAPATVAEVIRPLVGLDQNGNRATTVGSD